MTAGSLSDESAVKLVGVERHYPMGDNVVRALDGVDVDIKNGEYWAIMGASGSGKSTLLNVLGCLDRPTGGQYLLAGRDVSRLDDDELSEMRSRYLGFVFQSFHLIQQLTVEENVEVPLFYQGLSAEESRERALRMIDKVGLTDRVGHRPQELSGGQQQRVAVARALVNDPLVLLADEPTGNLDSKTSTEILALFDELHAQGRTIVLVTHDAAIAANANSILRLHDGRVKEIVHRTNGADGPSGGGSR